METVSIDESDSDFNLLKKTSSERGRELWGLLRESVSQTSDVIKKLDSEPAIVRHGVHHYRKINHDEAIIDVIYNPNTEEYVTVDTQFVRLFYKDGRRKDIIEVGTQITKLDFCIKSGQYVALVPDQEIRLYSYDFDIISVAKSPQKVISMIYNPSTNELITSGPGYLMTWCFRYGNRYIIPHRTTSKGLTCKDCFDKLALEKTKSNKQRCYAVCGTSIAVFNAFDVRLLTYKKDLHVRNITSVLFFNPLKYVVTGSRDGSIKIWDEHFNILQIFVGHHGTVSSLSVYPQGPYIMSSSHDCTIRVWSLESYDEVDLIVMEDPVLCLGTSPKESQLFTYSKYAVDLWNITHVHQMFTSAAGSITKLRMYPHKNLIDRAICQTKEGFVHVVSPADGTVITSLVPTSEYLPNNEVPHNNDTLPSPLREGNPTALFLVNDGVKRELRDSVYSLPLETIFALYGHDSLVKASTTTNPAKMQKIWTFNEDTELSCLCLYEYIIDIKQLKKTWEEVKSGKVVTRQFMNTPKYSNNSILLAGCNDGRIIRIDFFTGKVIYSTDGHSKRAVINMVSDAAAEQVISGGQDNVVKVWKMFPNTNEPLALLMSFYCAHVPVNLAIAGSRLAVGFQQPSTATYTLVMYDLISKERFDHSPDYDHTDDLMGVDCCCHLKLFASASQDGTIRIWNDDNTLVRVIKVSDDPKTVTFCNQRGDLLVGFGKNIHIIRHSDYLPKANLCRMLYMHFLDEEKEESLPFSDKFLDNIKPDSVIKVKNAKSSYLSVAHDWDPRTKEEDERLVFEEKDKLRMFAHFAARDQELWKIKEGSLKPKAAARKPSKFAQTRAFRKYMDLFYDRPKNIKIPDEDNFNPDPVVPRLPTPEVYKEEKKIGFFPPIESAKPIKEIVDDDDFEKEKFYDQSGPNFDTEQKYIICPSGFIPNSVLIKLLWPQDEVKKLEESEWKPPTLTREQLEMLQHMEKVTVEPPTEVVAEDDDHIDRVLIMESDDEWDELKHTTYDDDEIIDPSAGKKKFLTGSSIKRKESGDESEDAPLSFMDKMRKAMTTPPPPPKEPTPPPTPSPPPEPKIKSPTKPNKPIVRFVSRPPPPKQPTIVPPTPPPRTPTPPPPPPPPPPPKYVVQFQGLPWFERHKDYIMQRINDSSSATHFFNIICDLLGISVDWEHRSSIVDALLLLWQQEGLSNARHVIAALTSILNGTVPPSLKEPLQVLFLRSAIKLFQTVGGSSEDFAIEILTEYLEADVGFRSFLKSILIEQGLQDPHKYLDKELESWDLWQLDESKSMKPQLRKMVEKWLKNWNLRFKNHIEDTLEKLKKGNVKAKIRKPTVSKSSESVKRVQFEIPYDSVPNNASSIEVLNYFCEIKLEDEMESTRLADLKPEPSRNTVLVLPKLEKRKAIVRLGDMHTARRVRERRGQLAPEFKLSSLMNVYPDLMAPFSTKVILPTNRVYMNPFPSEIDRFDKWTDQYQPILLTLRSPAHQKYFIPERSYVHMV